MARGRWGEGKGRGGPRGGGQGLERPWIKNWDGPGGEVRVGAVQVGVFLNFKKFDFQNEQSKIALGILQFSFSKNFMNNNYGMKLALVVRQRSAKNRQKHTSQEPSDYLHLVCEEWDRPDGQTIHPKAESCTVWLI